jgi:hypothetical protein
MGRGWETSHSGVLCQIRANTKRDIKKTYKLK